MFKTKTGHAEYSILLYDFLKAQYDTSMKINRIY